MFHNSYARWGKPSSFIPVLSEEEAKDTRSGSSAGDDVGSSPFDVESWQGLSVERWRVSNHLFQWIQWFDPHFANHTVQYAIQLKEGTNGCLWVQCRRIRLAMSCDVNTVRDNRAVFCALCVSVYFVPGLVTGIASMCKLYYYKISSRINAYWIRV